MGDWKDRILTDDERIRDLLRETRRVAVLGIKTEGQADQAAFYVPKYLASAGLDVVPVPVYYPDAKEILGKRAYRRLADVPGPIDLVDVFRRPRDVAGHLEDMKAKRPRAVWMQLGIRNDDVAEALARDGILVVQDRCLMVEWRRLGPGH
ncbi:MAG TPA: CoA-binding protein [Anaeromyxobacter sp.]